MYDIFLHVMIHGSLSYSIIVSGKSYSDAKEWYHGTIPSEEFTEDMLNDYERVNTVFIRDYEVEKGISNFFEIYGISLTESDKMCRPYICRILRNVRQDRGLIRAPCCRILL